MNKSILAVIDATFKENLDQLTLHRMPGALPFAGKFRLIDFTLSNMRNSGITNVAIFPYGNYRSLQDHIGSGKRWDLDRRRDGLFILPPKNLNIIPGNMISFQRMYEHIEYFRRSNQEYAVITAPNIVWNIDFRKVLTNHIEEGADITEVMHQNIRLKTFVISKKLLLEYILTYDTLEYRNMLDLVEKAPNIKVHIYKHQGYTRTITDAFNYLKSNLDMLRFDTGRNVFREDRPIFSKEKTAPPAKYGQNARIENSMVSSGSVVDGTVINSIIGRDVIIRRGAIVKNSYVMSGCFIEENAHIEFAITDKQTVVKDNTMITGTLRRPFITQKEQIITNQKRQRICMVASESYPFIKTGGLADVIGSLSRNLARLGEDVTVIIPLYKKIKDSFSESLKREDGFSMTFGSEKVYFRKYSYTYKKVQYYFVESHDYFDRKQVYNYEDDVERFAFFNKAALMLIEQAEPFDVVHVHDWHTALMPLLIEHSSLRGLKTLLTIHNVDYQGFTHRSILDKLDIDEPTMRDEYFNCLEVGINMATKLSTVSPTYKEELKYEYYGKNLTYALLRRERDFYGILNGISSSWNPGKDKLIHTNYTLQSPELKVANKTYLQEIMNLEVNPERFMIGMVTRIVEQKGFDLILHSFDDLFAHHNIQFVLLGTGDIKYEQELKKLESRYPDKIKLNLGYDATVPNYIYAGCDAFLMPSRYEPCGLGQMIALRYGTLPIVRDTGGLADTVMKYDPITRRGNGFKFFNYDANECKQTILSALNLYQNNRTIWNQLMVRAMKLDNSLKRSASRYMELYRVIIEN
ncbi:glycogen/starch synthase [Candidatus Xianfuyuplasma coldseepsis]|uniref:Glycogen synthase n=1 Tax=Candidatus Xianfuyuplasma coldseepsis TaxID=2782163 RepID=A0A7L7KR69_9MOLU|nr:glycogen/starch synthase [Xianfuyuplasma coldseepsis]QMS84298.1 glycosyltransferase [Xianfuyuplasma coldseepsis]